MIVLRRLRVAALKQLRDIDVRFPQRGSMLIEGSNEAGKSTLFEAIYFALYGAALVGEDAHASLNALTPHGATEADATLTLQVGETELEVRRTLNIAKRQIHEAALTVRRPDAPPERLHGPRAVNDRILQELGGLDGDALRNSCLMEQQALDRIESLSRSDREEAIANLLGLKRLIAIEGELKPTAEDRAQVERLRERLRLAREAAARRRNAHAAQATADALALRLRVAETLALIADRDADGLRRREAAQRVAQLADEIGQLEANIAQAQRIGALARRLDDAETLRREATEACEALAQTDARLATLARMARDDLPLAERRLSDLRAQEATLAEALRARDTALADLRAAQEEMRQEQALADARMQRRQAQARLDEAATNAEIAYRQTRAALVEAECVAESARQTEALAQSAANTQTAAHETLARWVNARATADAQASANADAQAGAQTASEAAERLTRQRDASAVQLAQAHQRAQQTRTPVIVAALATGAALLIVGVSLMSQNVIMVGLACVTTLAALVALATLAVRWRGAVTDERAASASHQGAERAAYEAIARRDALLIALRDASLRATNPRLAGSLNADTPNATPAEPDTAALVAALGAVGLAIPATLTTGRATLVTLDAQGDARQQALLAAQANLRAAELRLAHARAADEAADRQRALARQAAQEHAATRNAADAPASSADDGSGHATLAARLTQAEQTHAAAEAALASLAATVNQGANQVDSRDAIDPGALAARRGAAQAMVSQLQTSLEERGSLAERHAGQAQHAQATLEALRAALLVTQHEAIALAIAPDADARPYPETAPDSPLAAPEPASFPMSMRDHDNGAEANEPAGAASHTDADEPVKSLTTLAAWRVRLASAVAAGLAAYDVAALHARLGASRAESQVLAAQLASAQQTQLIRVERIRAALAEQGVTCAGDEPLAELAARWPALLSVESVEAPAQDAPRSTAIPLPESGEGQPRVACDAAGWGLALDDLRLAYEQARRQADEARGAATQATARLRDHVGVAPQPEAAGLSPAAVGAMQGDATSGDATPDVIDGIGDALDEDACRARLAEAERSLLRRELAARMARDVRSRIARRVLPETEAYMRALLPELTAGRYRDVELLREDGAGQGVRGAGGADLRIRVWDQLAGRYVAKGLFSGGARDQVSLALRLAFALATLPKELGAIPGFIFLDEPLSAFDAERSAALERLLTRGVIARQFPQVFLISHSQSLDPHHFDYRMRMAAGRIVETNLPGA